jgi:O-Antigen ligase
MNKTISYSGLLLIHIVFGVLIYLFSKLSIGYGISILVFSILYIIKTQNNKNQVLYLAAYTVGSEVIMRMTGGMIFYEIAKYSIIAYMLMGMYFSGISKNSTPFWIFLIFLIPGIIYGTFQLNIDTDVQKAIAFNISGPICLGISALYCYQRNLTLKELDNVLLCMLLPIISTVTYMFLFTPDIKSVVTSTESNFETSGGFGPNQVSTIIGLGVFLAFTRILFYSKNKKILIFNIFLIMVLTFRGIVTFSRGGMFCGLFMIVLLIGILFITFKKNSKKKLYALIFSSIILLFGIWLYSSSQTNGLINKRYNNQDARGRIKNSVLTGREVIISNELDMFLDNPILGVGVGKGREDRLETTNVNIASHDEITRLLSEHGSFGLACFLILFITPLLLLINNKKHIYLLSFFLFWLLTINHAAMRLAAPAFVYALSLLHIYKLEEE